MNRFISSILFLVFCITTTIAQDYWKPTLKSEFRIQSIEEVIINTHKASYFELNRIALSKEASKQNTIFLPSPTGELQLFSIQEKNVMESGLKKKYPNIKTYYVQSVDNPEIQGFLDFGSMGFHGNISSPNGTYYIDPYTKASDLNYQVYFTKDEIIDGSHNLTCGVTDDGLHDHFNHIDHQHTTLSKNTKKLDIIDLYTYRIAIACTGEWGQNFPDKEAVLSRMVTGLNRLNQIYIKDVGVEFILIDNTDELIFQDPNDDPYFNASLGSSLLQQNTSVINNIIGSGNYDIGHIFTINCTDVGGVANLASLCQNNKGAGVSCVGNSNISSFAVSTISHEVGHQFAASHTWSNCPSSADQLAPGTAFEPGSGSTIMSYAGLCGNQNFTNTNDDYFHAGSLEQMYGFTRNIIGSSCGEQIASGNNSPVINLKYENGFSIPILTPFELEGSATDEDGDNLTYGWDQVNTGPLSELGSPIGNAPSFRSYDPINDPTRIFPKLTTILANQNPREEKLPESSRSLDFRFIVRDNNPTAGAVVWEDVSFKSTSSAGPFFVTYPNINIQEPFKVGQEVTVTWDVANTDVSPVNCQFVDISLSADAGLNYNYELASRTPNDGEETIIIPFAPSNLVRIKVQANDNIFFDISNQNFRVELPDEAGFFFEIGQSQYEFCLPFDLNIPVETFGFSGFAEDIKLEIIDGVPNGATASFDDPITIPDTITNLNINLTNEVVSGSYEINIRASAEGQDTLNKSIILNVKSTDLQGLTLSSPESGTDGISQLPEFSWNPITNADNYTIEIATNPNFSEDNIVIRGTSIDSSFTPDEILELSSLYYWRIIANNDCGATTTTAFSTFGTEALTCFTYESFDLPINISQSGLPTVESKIFIEQEGTVSLVAIPKIKALHDFVSQIKASIISPQGTEVLLFERACGNGSNFNCGFNDNSPFDVSCPLNNVYQPFEPLSIFKGESIQGDWILRLEDTGAGDGGQFQNFELEVCSSESLNGPYFINKKTLEIPTGLAGRLNAGVLKVGDDNNTHDELIFTLTSLPSFGYLELNGLEVEIGSQFSQANINNSDIKYFHDGSIEEFDQFTYTVIDGEGGWIDITVQEIFIGSDVVSGIEDLEERTWNVFPNPTNSILYINSENELIENANIDIINMQGQLVYNKKLNNFKSGSINLVDFDNGIYIIKITEGQKITTKKISLIK